MSQSYRELCLQYKKISVVTLVLSAACILLIVILYPGSLHLHHPVTDAQRVVQWTPGLRWAVGTDNQGMLEERNALSRQLNAAMQQIGQLQCKSGAQPQTGGWCKADSAPDSTQHQTDSNLANTIANLLRGKTVASFGDGPGKYKKIILDSGLVKKYDAFDGAPFVEEVTGNEVRYLDLSIPQYGLEVYQWVVSLEVAEHIPRPYEDIYLSNLARHASEGVILSWAVPGQPGHRHVNLRTPEHVKGKMGMLGFHEESHMSEVLRGNATLWWLQKNTYAYRRQNPPKHQQQYA